MKNKSLYELGKLAKNGNEMAMLEIINRKKPLLLKYSYGDEDRYQYLVLKLIEAIKKYRFWNFLNFFKIYGRIFLTGLMYI